MAGYSNTPLPKKLGIIDDAVFVVFDGPDDFEQTLGDYGDAVWQKSMLAPARCRRRLLHVSSQVEGSVAEVDQGRGTVWLRLGRVAEEDQRSGDRHHGDRAARGPVADRLGRQQGVCHRQHMERPSIRTSQGEPPGRRKAPPTRSGRVGRKALGLGVITCWVGRARGGRASQCSSPAGTTSPPLRW